MFDQFGVVVKDLAALIALVIVNTCNTNPKLLNEIVPGGIRNRFPEMNACNASQVGLVWFRQFTSYLRVLICNKGQLAEVGHFDVYASIVVSGKQLATDVALIPRKTLQKRYINHRT